MLIVAARFRNIPLLSGSGSQVLSICVYHLSRLDNGLTIATAEMPHMTSIAVGLWIGIGGRYEAAEVSGVAHFIEHLLFKGTSRRSAREISEAVEGAGGYLNAFTTEELTCFHARAQHTRLEELLDVLSDMLLNSRFAAADIAKERDVIKEEIAMYRDQPHQLVQDLLHETIWPGHPLGRPLTGTEKTLDAIHRSEMLNFFYTNYTAANTLLTVAGPHSHQQVCRAFSRMARKFNPGRKPAFLPADSPQKAPAVCIHPKRTEQAQLAIGVRTCSRHDERRYALRVLNAILGENMSSRLFQILREDKGLAYSIYSAWAFMEDTGALTISAGLDTKDLPMSLRIIARELRRLSATPVAISELRRAKDYLVGQMDLNLEGTENQMNWLGESFIGYGKIVPPAQIKERICRVTAAQVRAAASEFFRPERISLALVSPFEKREQLKLPRW